MDGEQPGFPCPVTGGRLVSARMLATCTLAAFHEQHGEEQVCLEANGQPGQAPAARAWDSVKASTLIEISGSAPCWLGWAWCRLCLLTHQP